MKRKSKAELQAELDAANKRCADLADALVKALMAQPVIVPFVVPQPVPQPWPLYPTWVGPTLPAPFVSPTVAPFSEPWVITTCSTSDKVTS